MLLRWPANVPGVIKQTASGWENGKHSISCLFPSFLLVIKCFTSFSRSTGTGPYLSFELWNWASTSERGIFTILQTICQVITEMRTTVGGVYAYFNVIGNFRSNIFCGYLTFLCQNRTVICSFSMPDPSCSPLLLRYGSICVLCQYNDNFWTHLSKNTKYINTYI